MMQILKGCNSGAMFWIFSIRNIEVSNPYGENICVQMMNLLCPVWNNICKTSFKS